MKKYIILLFITILSCSLSAQNTYNVNGENFELKTEVEGSINLLWNIIDGEYRYFLQKDTEIVELVNNKNENGDFNEEYISTLKKLTNNNNLTSKTVKLVLPSLKKVVNEYNASVDNDFTYESNKLKVNTRLGVFGGLTNNPFVENPENNTSGLLGAELELYDDNLAKRHAAFFQLTHILKSDNPDFTTTEIALGYRFKFINTNKISVHANLKLVTLSFSKSSFTYTNEQNEEVTQGKSATSFDAPVIFGLGADFKVSDNGFITLYYNELFALSLENQGNFSTNIAIGYKFNL